MHRLSILCLLVLLYFIRKLGLCLSIRKKSSRLENLEEPRPTLLATAMVRVGEKDGEDGGGLMDAALNIAMNMDTRSLWR